MGFQPERTRSQRRIYRDPLPPCRFIAVAVSLAMVAAAERDGELVAHLSCHRTHLRKAQVMRVARLSPAHEAGLLRDVPDVVPVPDAAGLWKGKHAFVRAVRLCTVPGLAPLCSAVARLP